MFGRKTFIGRVLGVTRNGVVMSLNEGAITIQAGEAVLRQATAQLGRTVRYSVDVASDTQCLSNPRFVIGSEMGLLAVAQTTLERLHDEGGRQHGWTHAGDLGLVPDWTGE